MTTPVPPIWVMDTECYKDYFLVMFRNVYSRETICKEVYLDHSDILTSWPKGTIVTFNGIKYDFPMLSVALAGGSNAVLKTVSDDIILNNLQPWVVGDKYGGVDMSGIDHIDLIEVVPGMGSLKVYGGRMNSKRLQDLPIEPDASTTPADRKTLIEYCGNDLDTTIDLYLTLLPQIKLRQAMSKEFGIDLRSKSDAQIAECVIRKSVESKLGRRIYRPELHPSYTFNYRMPEYIKFESEGMARLLGVVNTSNFGISEDGSVELPKAIADMRVCIGSGKYKMGIGGLHSCEKSVARHADDETFLKDIDVRSYYPTIILNDGLYPSHMGPEFLTVYRSLVERRLEAKDAGNKVLADALKICVNGSFGKLGSKWSVLYAPDLLIQVTLTGQLALLMLIEMIDGIGMHVVSANTDGIVVKGERDRELELSGIVYEWESITKFETESVEYTSLYSKDVNNYIAIKPDGTTKTKGLYSTVGLQKNPTNTVCVEAVIKHLTEGTEIYKSVHYERDIRKFLTIRKVNGGASYNGEYLGKAVRWYYSNSSTKYIKYVTNGNKVAKSDGCVPLMVIPEELPTDIDYDWYIDEAKSIRRDIGVI